MPFISRTVRLTVARTSYSTPLIPILMYCLLLGATAVVCASLLLQMKQTDKVRKQHEQIFEAEVLRAQAEKDSKMKSAFLSTMSQYVACNHLSPLPSTNKRPHPFPSKLAQPLPKSLFARAADVCRLVSHIIH